MSIRTVAIPAFALVAVFATSASAHEGGHHPRFACREDVKKFCGEVKIGEGHAGIESCLKLHETELSASCTAQRVQVKAHIDAFKAACGKDVEAFCKSESAATEGEGIRERGHAVMHCLKAHTSELSESCKTFHAEHSFHHGGHGQDEQPAPPADNVERAQ